MASVFDAAEWFLQKEPVSHKKLQKLCYYACAWSYALLDKKLFDDTEFEAWVHGPASPQLYEKYTGNGWQAIQPEGRSVHFLDDELDLLESVYVTYGESSANSLEVLSHSEPPWKIARAGCAANERCSRKIDVNEMKKYYRSIYSGDDA